MPRAIITLIESEVLPVQVEFPNHIGHYKSVEHALADISIFKCMPVFK